MCIYVPEDEYPHAAPQLRPTPADERHPHQLPITLAGTLFNSDYAHLPGACARPDGEPGDGAVMEMTCLKGRVCIL